MSTPLLEYLLTNSYRESILSLLLVFLFAALLLVCLVVIYYFSTVWYSYRNHRITYDKDKYNYYLNKLMERLPNLTFSLLIVGILLFAISRNDVLKFSYFKNFGIFTGLLTSIIVIGFITYLFNHFKNKQEK